MGILKGLGLSALTVIAIFLMGSLPGLFVNVHVDFINYLRTLQFVFHQFQHLTDMTFTTHSYNKITHPVFPFVFDHWRYSLILLFISFCFSFLVASLLSFLTMLLPLKVIQVIKGFLFFLESIPDLLMMITIQLTVIWLYQQTGNHFFQAYSFNHPLYGLPILSLSILPTIFIYRMLVLEIEDEAFKDYAEFAISKGLTKWEILLRHIMRNTLLKTLAHAKTIIVFMLSNLLIVELVYNSDGLLQFVYTYRSPDLLTLSMFLFFIPLFLFLWVCRVLINWLTGESISVD